MGIQCLRCSRCLKTKTIDICFIRTVEKIRFINYFQSKISSNIDVANIYWEHFCGFDDRSDLSENKQKCHQHLKSGFKIYIIVVADPVIHGSKKAFSSIFLWIFHCLKCITGWPWLYLGLNQQTNSYFIDNLRDDPGDSGQTVMFMIQASDTNLFTVLMLCPYIILLATLSIIF